MAEISIAIFFVGIVLLSIMGLILQTHKAANYAAASTAVACIGQSKMEEMKAGIVTEGGEEFVTVNQMNYEVKWDKSLVAEDRSSKLYKAFVTVHWKHDSKNQVTLFSAYLTDENDVVNKPKW